MVRSYGATGKGWLTPPFPLTLDSSPFILRGESLNVAFRFGVEQADKLRACDDLRHSLANLACVVSTPIKLASWGHVAEMCNRVGGPGRDWHFLKADHEAAYKQPLLSPATLSLPRSLSVLRRTAPGTASLVALFYSAL